MFIAVLTKAPRTLIGSLVLEYLAVKCGPFITLFMIMAVSIAPEANANWALSYLLSAVSSQQNKSPEALQIITGNFNHFDLKVAIPKFYHHINCGAKRVNTMDKVYSAEGHTITLPLASLATHPWS